MYGGWSCAMVKVSLWGWEKAWLTENKEISLGVTKENRKNRNKENKGSRDGTLYLALRYKIWY